MAVKDLPGEARVVVIGGGIVGCSVAYHLGRLGFSDTVLVERDELTSGTSWHAAGVVGPLRSSYNLTRLSMYAVELFSGLEAETGQATGYTQTGGLWLAQTPDRIRELERTAANGEIAGLEAGVVGRDEIKARFPLLEVDDLEGALWVPADGQANPVDTTMAYAKGARRAGVTICEKTTVEAIETKNGRVAGVVTDRGKVRCEYVVNCCGMWARQLAATAGVAVPLQAAEHMYIVTEPVDALPDPVPVTRDLDGYIYVKEDAGKLVLGGFEPEAKPWHVDGIPMDASFTMLPEDWDQFSLFLENAVRRMPIFETVGVRQFMNGPESFTPDTRQIIGEAPELKGFFVAAGFNSIGVVSSAGAGKVIAEWIEAGEPPMDLWDVDIKRFGPDQATRAFLAERTVETLGNLFAMHWPYKQARTARNLRLAPLHDRYAAAGACFGAPAMGWERPLWFADPDAGETPEMRYSYGAQPWWPAAEREALAVRDAVALFELTPFSKFLVEGPDAERELQRLCSADVAVGPGQTVYTQMLNPSGGIEADITVMRLDDDRFQVIGGAPTRIKDRAWIRDHVDAAARLTLTDVTSASAVLGVWGPEARALMQRVSSADLANEAFPFATTREIDVGAAVVRANRMSFAGELGWELYVPAELAGHVYDRLVEAGADMGLRHAGLLCLDACRVEKGYRHWGHDIGPEETPLEAGLAFAVAWDKPGGFIGREALLRRREQGTERRLLVFDVADADDGEPPLLLHDEPIYRDGVLVGKTTSGARGFRTGQSIALGYVRPPDGERCSKDVLLAGSYEIKVAGRRHAATPMWRAPYDPEGARLRA